MNNVIPIKPGIVKHHICDVLHSKEDKSVNFVFPNGQEARYVRRTDDYFIVYISSHGGCDRACRMCHLTQTGQTEMVPATIDEMLLQATVVLAHYQREVETDNQAPVQKIHFNWMARGEPLMNHDLVYQWEELSTRLSLLAQAAVAPDVEVKFKISTIIPAAPYDTNFILQRTTANKELRRKLKQLMSGAMKPEIYYSLYSVDFGFRKRWLPKSHLPIEALEVLATAQREHNFDVTLHWAYIEGENDSENDTQVIKNIVNKFGLVAKFNLVRYNPYSPDQGKEPPEEVLQRNFNEIASVMKRPGSRIVPRVGRDVAASCGTFINLIGD